MYQLVLFLLAAICVLPFIASADAAVVITPMEEKRVIPVHTVQLSQNAVAADVPSRSDVDAPVSPASRRAIHKERHSERKKNRAHKREQRREGRKQRIEKRQERKAEQREIRQQRRVNQPVPAVR